MKKPPRARAELVASALIREGEQLLAGLDRTDLSRLAKQCARLATIAVNTEGIEFTDPGQVTGRLSIVSFVHGFAAAEVIYRAVQQEASRA